MTIRSTERAIRPDAGGFVLIGVVMLILALTILGLSLFSLSSYEAQFINDSIDQEQAFLVAQGGIERAKFAIAGSEDHLLSRVKDNLPLEHVVDAVARQLQGSEIDSVGPIEWDGEDVEIQVTVDYHGVRRSVLGTYDPTRTESLYKQLIASHDSVVVNVTGSGGALSHNHTVVFSGLVRQGNADVSWKDSVYAYSPPIGITPTPIPDRANYIAAHRDGALEPEVTGVTGSGDMEVSLTGGTGNVRYFYSPDAGPYYSLQKSGGGATIWVGGRVVWMLDKGLRISELTKVRRAAGATGDVCLLIVSGPNGRVSSPDDPAAGIWFFGGLDSPEVPVILVSDGRVLNEQYNDYDHSTWVPYLSIFAGDVQITGPRAGYSPALFMNLGHGEGVMNPLIDFLAHEGALPNTSTAMGSFALRGGTWRNVSP